MLEVKTSLLSKVIAGFQSKANVAILMSGGGSNAENLLEHRQRYPNLHMSTIVTDQRASRASVIAEKYGCDSVSIEGSTRTSKRREELFSRIGAALEAKQIDLILYAGFMRIATRSFCTRFPGVNIHPADLTVRDSSGLAKYRGMNVIEEAILGGDRYLASSVHVVDYLVDEGDVLAVSPQLDRSTLPGLSTAEIHEQMKVQCEHPTYPAVIEMLANGSFTEANIPIQLQTLEPKGDQ
jgi:phosphoribosylglycinamide formyltransferase-1